MATTPTPEQSPETGTTASTHSASSSIEALILAAQARGDESGETGRHLVTFKEGALDEGIAGLKTQRMRVADARDFDSQAITLEDVGDADAVVFPEIGAALVGATAFEARGMKAAAELPADSAIEAIEPEYFVFAAGATEQYLQGFMRAAETIARDIGRFPPPSDDAAEAQVLGTTWGLSRCKVPPGTRSGAGIRVAVLDTGLDLGHADFARRTIVSKTFVEDAVQDHHGHGTHTAGTACGPRSPRGSTPRYGIAYRAQLYIGKVLSNAGSGATASVLAGMNWAIANRCAVISMSLGSDAPVQAAYTAAGQAALKKGCLIVAASGNSASNTGAPANSPTILSVASIDPSMQPSEFSNFGKVELAAPGRDVFSAAPRPARYRTMSGTSMATPHVAGCAALWAQTHAELRGQALWDKLLGTARELPSPAERVGRGLVQAP